MNSTRLSSPRSHAPQTLQRRQSGITLIIALIALVALTMAGIALVRSVDTGNVIAGNFAFRQASLQATDTGVEAAFTNLQTVIIPTSLDAAIANRYFPVIQPLDSNGVPTTVDWTQVTATSLGSNNEYQVKYVVERLCSGSLPIVDLSASCVVDQAQTGGSQKAGAPPPPNGAGAVNYRVTVRVEGPRNTVAMSQAIIAF